MNEKEFFKKWVEALRSGKYKQSHGALYSEMDDAFCALGVGCMVATDNMHPMNLYGHTHPEDVGDYITSDNEINILYESFFDFLQKRNQVNEHNDKLINKGLFDVIMSLNDRYLASFDEIAQFIEIYAKNMLNRKDAMEKTLEEIYNYISLYEVKIYNNKGEK